MTFTTRAELMDMKDGVPTCWRIWGLYFILDKSRKKDPPVEIKF